MDIRNGNCLELMKTIPDKSVDLFICDLPYGDGATSCKWDIRIDLEEFWKQFKRIRKSKRTACIHFCTTKFGYTLIKSWEKGFKMDMVWKKRNKTGGLQSRYRPMRNHEMVYFFYEQTPKYNRDKYHKRIEPVKKHEVEKEGGVYGTKTSKMGTMNNFQPPNPASVLEYEDEDKELTDDNRFFSKVAFKGSVKKTMKDYKNRKVNFNPVQPGSVIDEDAEEEKPQDIYGETKEERKNIRESDCIFEPPNPGSVFDSKKVFIGKRHHQTEKPQDILEFFLKYWTDEGDTILDPTMGSGSTGVACKKLSRKFIGFELDSKIFEIAKKRIEKN